MPIYEYECQNCGKVIECFEKPGYPPISICDYCGGELKKIMSKNTFHLKGDGWFKRVKEKSKGN